MSEKMVWRHRFMFSGSGKFKLRNLHFLIDVFTYFQKKIRWTINKSKINVIDWIDYACMHGFLSLSVFSHISLWMYNEFLQFPFRPGEIVPDFYVVVTVVLVTGWQIEAIDFNLDLRFFRSLSKYNTLNFGRGRHRRW